MDLQYSLWRGILLYFAAYCLFYLDFSDLYTFYEDDWIRVLGTDTIEQ